MKMVNISLRTKIMLFKITSFTLKKAKRVSSMEIRMSLLAKKANSQQKIIKTFIRTQKTKKTGTLLITQQLVAFKL